MSETDEKWMWVAIEAANRAREIDEVPVGACIVDGKGDLLASGYNLTITNSDPTAHAEIVAIRAAPAKLGNYRLPGKTVYTTIEPCAMCAGALVNARVKRIVFGSLDERFGGIETHFGIGKGGELDHRVEIVWGVLAGECRELMEDFFRERRK